MATSSASPNYNTTTDDEAFGELETALRRQIKDTLQGVATSHDKLALSHEELDGRVQIVEQRLPKNLRFRLKTIEDHVKSQESINSSLPNNRASSHSDAALATKVKALEDVNATLAGKLSFMQSQLDQHKRNLDRISKKNTTLDDSDPVVQELLKRLYLLETQRSGSRSTFEAWTNDEVAEELLRRLTEGGEGISPNLSAHLHSLTASKLSVVTEGAKGAGRRKSSATDSTNSEQQSSTSSDIPHKPRKRSAPAATELLSLSDLSSIQDSGPEESEPPSKRTRTTSAAAVRISPRKISSMFKTTKSTPAENTKSASQNDAEGDYDMSELALLQDEPRRSGRKPKPARNPQYLTWLEVRAAKKRGTLD
ncbi:hypothetical protein CB0940_00857 [Cercospora beticola]|uniref:Uncharacterized protein n=1 Tax=Cercospora beticola TaxID=122368 RepID=A0A2G5IC47_CERBT|nr:hypothetical protein CB0940_00857 [Cercospora beticola]PIB02341.1 hypothetical protein CB0940_00857 [Cercospora beticola]WPA96285.1 hypothetical protein RHO25_000891 [Cercospora beticola]CAK1355418.1 unnamed protein product [Cercospora beticola]